MDVPGATGGGATLTTTRHYPTAGDLRREIVDARVWAGLHYRHSGVVGVRLGRTVAHYDLTHSGGRAYAAARAAGGRGRSSSVATRALTSSPSYPRKTSELRLRMTSSTSSAHSAWRAQTTCAAIYFQPTHHRHDHD